MLQEKHSTLKMPLQGMVPVLWDYHLLSIQECMPIQAGKLLKLVSIYPENKHYICSNEEIYLYEEMSIIFGMHHIVRADLTTVPYAQ